MIYSDTPTAATESAAIPNASTGPRTEEGKAVASRNAVKHNLCSKRLTGSDLEEFKALRTQFEDEWEPRTETERLLLDQMALCQWRIDRALSLELNAFDDDHLDPALLALALRYRTTAERGFYKALSELQRLRASIRQVAIRELKAEEQQSKALFTAALDHLCFAPVGAPLPPQFVSQNVATDCNPDPSRNRNGAVL
ncbi:MAG TPA: hypothetical protein VN633_10835 [Bryobacteraceae bacterium]|nr:hypothetical protein [Bryobacteraceae bacterium]